MNNVIRYPHVIFIDGLWRVEGSRVPVTNLYTSHMKGATFATLFRVYKDLGPSKILSAVAFCYDNISLIGEER